MNPQVHKYPEIIKNFVNAAYANTDYWYNDDLIAEHLRSEGNKEYFIKTMLSYTQAMRDLYLCLKLRVSIIYHAITIV